jgi:PKD repeat protein
MENYIPINGQSIKLLAYASSGLPVSYSVIEGAGNVSITPNGDFFYISPVAIGYSKLLATQSGNEEYARAYPVSKLVRVIGLPDTLTVEASVMVEPLAPSIPVIQQLEPPSEISGLLDTAPLEPTSVRIIDRTPKKASKVVALCAPSGLSSVTVYDYDDRPAGYGQDAIVVRASIIIAPQEEPSFVYASQVQAPTMQYALELTKLQNKRSAETTAQVKLFNIDPRLLWDEAFTTNSTITNVRNQYLTTSTDLYGLTYNPMMTFESRPALDITEFYFNDTSNISLAGKYVQEKEADSAYRIVWKQWGTSTPFYIYFVAVKVHVHVLNIDALGQNDAGISGLNKFYEYEDSLYASGHTGGTAYEDWEYNNILLNYGPDVIWDIANTKNFGFYIIDSDKNKSRGYNLHCLYPYSGTEISFNALSTQQQKLLVYGASKDAVARSGAILFDHLAGDPLYHYDAWDSSLQKNDWSPVYPTPFQENFKDIHPDFGIQPYAIGGENIVIELADKSTLPLSASAVTATGT